MGKSQQAFFELLRAGLWEKEARLSAFDRIDFPAIFNLATEQSVVGLVAAGIEHLADMKVPKADAFPFMSTVLQLEHRNRAMNAFIVQLITGLREDGIEAVLVKGQGVAQCYERPQWRACGDVDLLLATDGYAKAKELLLPMAEQAEEENVAKLHLALTLKGFVVELHGKMPFAMSSSVDKVIDDVLKATLEDGDVRKWKVNETDILLPKPDNDVLIVFTHFLHHLFIEGVGLRQICDWCRLLWTYRESLNGGLLESRIREMGLMTEWQAFAALAVEFLGMPVEAMPLYDDSKRFRRKADRIMKHVLKCGNFGHNNDVSYRRKHPALMVNAITFSRRMRDFIKLSAVFPLDSPRFFMSYVMWRVKG